MSFPTSAFAHRDLRDPIALMVDHDVAVPAGGMASLERATLGVPSVIVPSTLLEVAAARVLAQHARACVIDANDSH